MYIYIYVGDVGTLGLSLGRSPILGDQNPTLEVG